MGKLPPYLYRGDADPNGVRKLREWRRGFLLTNLSNGGSGLEIFCAPIVEFINRHVDIGWEKTHFLSFSESRERAIVFSGAREGHDLKVDTGQWDAALMTIDTSIFIDLEVDDVGIYRCAYTVLPLNHNRQTLSDLLYYGIPRQVASVNRQGRPMPVLLIDVVSFLREEIRKGQRNLEGSLEKAIRDSEWLVLPLDAADGIPGERTAALDISCISTFEFLGSHD